MLDNTLVLPKKQELDRSEIRKVLRRALRPAPRANYHKPHWPKWLEDRLTTLAIYGYSDKSEYPHQKAVECLRLYGQGMSYDAIAHNVQLSKGTVQVYISNLIDWIIDSTPIYLLRNIPVENTTYRINGCPHCGGTLAWDESEGEYWCLSCARSFDESNSSTVKN